MSSPRTLIKVGGAGVLVLIVGLWGYNKFYASKRDALLDELATLTTQNAEYEKAVQRIGPARRAIAEHARGAVGGSVDQAEHVLRTGLAALVTEAGVHDATISSERPRPVASPYINARGTNRAIRDLLKKQADFATIGASVQATGSLEQTLQLVALAQSQPWLHRVLRISLKPADQERTRFDIDLRTRSLYMPDVVREAHALVVAPMDPLALDRITPIAMKNVFRYMPNAPAPPAAVVVVDDAPKPPPPPPYDKWRLSGVAMGTVGVEVWLANPSTGEWRTLSRGQSLLGARFLGAQPQQERAVFEIDGTQYEFFTDSVMTERREIPESDRPT